MSSSCQFQSFFFKKSLGWEDGFIVWRSEAAICGLLLLRLSPALGQKLHSKTCFFFWHVPYCLVPSSWFWSCWTVLLLLSSPPTTPVTLILPSVLIIRLQRCDVPREASRSYHYDRLGTISLPARLFIAVDPVVTKPAAGRLFGQVTELLYIYIICINIYKY